MDNSGWLTLKHTSSTGAWGALAVGTLKANEIRANTFKSNGKLILTNSDSEQAHYIKRFSDDTDGFGVSTGFTVKHYSSEANLFSVDMSGNAVASGTVTAPTFSGNLNGNAATATNSTNALRITFNDGPRNLSDRLPNSFTRTVNFDFVSASTVSGTGSYAGVMTFSPWDGTTNSKGDSSYQLAFINEQV